MRSLTRALVAVAALSSGALAVHAVINSILLRTPEQPRSGGEQAIERGGERVSLLLPVRDEERNIASCLSAALAVMGVDEVIVLDDASTDRTADLARELTSDEPRATVITTEQSEQIPVGWLGKNWACHRLAEHASGSVLVFVDADVTLAPNALAATVALMRAQDFDLVSPYPRQLADGVLPRLIQPLLQWSWLTFVPLRLSEVSERPSLAVANGQLLAVDADAYRRAGGHAAVRGDVIEDVALARAIRTIGGRTAVVDGTDLATCRMYETGSELVDGYSKSLWAALGSPSAAAATCGVLAFVYLVPPAAAVTSRDPATRRWGIAGYVAAVIGRVAVARRTGQRLLPDVAAHPASIAGLIALTLNSLVRRQRGTLTWKGRPVG